MKTCILTSILLTVILVIKKISLFDRRESSYEVSGGYGHLKPVFPLRG